jgi:hypothetical protein
MFYDVHEVGRDIVAVPHLGGGRWLGGLALSLICVLTVSVTHRATGS